MCGSIGPPCRHVATALRTVPLPLGIYHRVATHISECIWHVRRSMWQSDAVSTNRTYIILLNGRVTLSMYDAPPITRACKLSRRGPVAAVCGIDSWHVYAHPASAAQWCNGICGLRSLDVASVPSFDDLRHLQCGLRFASMCAVDKEE